MMAAAVEYDYYLGEGPEANALICDVKKMFWTMLAARMKLATDYGATELLVSSWNSSPVGLLFKQKQNVVYLKGGKRNYNGYTYYPKKTTKVGRELCNRLAEEKLKFSAAQHIANELGLSSSGCCTKAGYHEDKILIMMPTTKGKAKVGNTQNIPAWLRKVKESEFLAAQGR